MSERPRLHTSSSRALPLAAVRALRVLQLLVRESDDAHRLPAAYLAHELKAPQEPGALSVDASPSDVRDAVATLRLIGLPVASTHHGGYWLKTSPFSDAEMGLVLHAVRTHPRLTRLERCALEKRLLALGTPTQRSRWQLHTPASTHSKRHMESSIIPFERTDPLSLIRRALPQHSHVIYQLASDASLSKSACQTFAAHVLRHSGQSWFVGGVDTSTGLVHRMVRLDRIACLVTHDVGGVVLIAEGALNGEV